MGELRPRLPEIAAAGVSLLLIGNGSPEQLRAFVAEHALDLPGVTVLTDPELQTYRATSLVRGLLATAGPRSLVNLVRARRHGYTQTGVFGDRLQQGGVLVLDGAGEVVLHHVNRSLGGHLAPERLVAAARLAGVRGVSAPAARDAARPATPLPPPPDRR